MQRVGHRGVEGEGTQIRGLGILGLALQLQDVTELQVRVGYARVEIQCLSIGALRLRQLVGIAQFAGLF